LIISSGEGEKDGRFIRVVIIRKKSLFFKEEGKEEKRGGSIKRTLNLQSRIVVGKKNRQVFGRGCRKVCALALSSGEGRRCRKVPFSNPGGTLERKSRKKSSPRGEGGEKKKRGTLRLLEEETIAVVDGTRVFWEGTKSSGAMNLRRSHL